MHIMEGECEKTAVTEEEGPVKPAETPNGLDKPHEAEENGAPTEISAEEEPVAEVPLENGHPSESPLAEEEVKELIEEEPKVTEDGEIKELSAVPSPVVEPPSSPCKEPEPTTTPPEEEPPAPVQSQESKQEICSEDEEDVHPIPIPTNIKPEVEVIRKRSIEVEREGEASSSSESDSMRKRLKPEVKEEPPPTRPSHTDHLITTEDERESTIQRFLESCAQSLDEINQASEKLHKEINALSELAKTKELEWNSILRLKKLKEEMYERLHRRKRENLINEGKYTDDLLLSTHNMMPSIESSITVQPQMANFMQNKMHHNAMMHAHRPIMPKPMHPHSGMDQPPPDHVRHGRNGHLIDVKSIIADYGRNYRGGLNMNRRFRDGNPSRRGRKIRPDQMVVSSASMSSSPSLISMANMALGTGSSVRTIHDLPPNPPPTSFNDRPDRDFWGMKGAPVKAKGVGGRLGGPQYPEVTLHPVGAPPPSTSSSSLLHGILTKGPPPPTAHSAKPTTFSPTLARLLTAPDPRPAHQPAAPAYHHPPSLNINILASKKARTDITITPVSGNPSSTTNVKEEVVLLDEDEEASGGDRLVIDESGGDGPEDVPQCQGCRQKPAQFVCAGCGNQWYCSRECQVAAWEEHSDVCSG